MINSNHPIENLMGTTMENIRDMIDVNTVVGDAIETRDGSYIIPISKFPLDLLREAQNFQIKNVKK